MYWRIQYTSVSIHHQFPSGHVLQIIARYMYQHAGLVLFSHLRTARFMKDNISPSPLWLWFIQQWSVMIRASSNVWWNPWKPPALIDPGRFKWKFVLVIFRLILVMHGGGISCDIALRWISLDFTDDKSTLVQVMAWCRQATSHYLSQCWPRSMSTYALTGPQWVNGVMSCSQCTGVVYWGHSWCTIVSHWNIDHQCLHMISW